jgi:hypothetical protein
MIRGRILRQGRASRSHRECYQVQETAESRACSGGQIPAAMGAMVGFEWPKDESPAFGGLPDSWIRSLEVERSSPWRKLYAFGPDLAPCHLRPSRLGHRYVTVIQGHTNSLSFLGCPSTWLLLLLSFLGHTITESCQMIPVNRCAWIGHMAQNCIHSNAHKWTSLLCRYALCVFFSLTHLISVGAGHLVEINYHFQHHHLGTLARTI